VFERDRCAGHRPIFRSLNIVVPLSYVLFVASGEFDEGLAQLTAAADSLLAADVSSLEAATLVEALRRFEAQRRRLEAVEHRLLRQANDTHLPASCAMRTVAGVLAQVSRIDPREARQRENRALDCGPRVTLTGEVLEPVLPQLAAAIAEGVVSPAQVDVIVEAMQHIPDGAPAEAWPVVERVLVAAARFEAPRLAPAHGPRTTHPLGSGRRSGGGAAAGAGSLLHVVAVAEWVGAGGGAVGSAVDRAVAGGAGCVGRAAAGRGWHAGSALGPATAP